MSKNNNSDIEDMMKEIFGGKTVIKDIIEKLQNKKVKEVDDGKDELVRNMVEAMGAMLDLHTEFAKKDTELLEALMEGQAKLIEGAKVREETVSMMRKAIEETKEAGLLR